MPARQAKRLLLIGLDGADWQLIHPLVDAGNLPNIASLVNGGAMADLQTLDPSVCCMHWTSILTGQRASEHGVIAPIEVDPRSRRPRIVRSHRRQVPNLCEVLGHHGIRSLDIAWPATYPAAMINGVQLADVFARPVGPLSEAWPLAESAVHPIELGSTLAQHRVHPSEIGAPELLPFVPNLASAPDHPGLRELARVLAETLSVHGATTALLEQEPWEFCAVHYDILNAVCRSFMRFQPPRMSAVDEASYELFKNVVTTAYHFTDQMLGRLLTLAGDDAHVMIVSDHGFHCDTLRPRDGDRHGLDETANWHRNVGVFCLKGDGICADARIPPIAALDIMPTVLSLFGVPLADDMPGRVAASAFVNPPVVERVATWSNLRPPPPPLARDADDTGPENGYLVLRDLAIEDVTKDAQLAEDYNLARAHLGAENAAAAIPLLESLCEQRPGDLRFQLFLAEALHAMADTNACRTVLHRILDRQERHPRANFLLASLQLAEGKDDEALASLRRAEGTRAHRARHFIDVAEAYLRLEQWDDATRCLERAVAVDVSDHRAWISLCRSHLGQQRGEAAIRAAQQAMGLAPENADAHLYFGFALEMRGDHNAAAAKFRRCLELAPQSNLAHTALATFYETHGADPTQATYHRAMARSDVS